MVCFYAKPLKSNVYIIHRMQTSQFCLATFECFSNHLCFVITTIGWGRVDDFSV